ncbi:MULTISPECIES: TetR family transcriptional regulator [unclassified Streptomyces]|uniref:TetR/AcrR family transcriptional regulator n=1 Tax=unclassified Streptomyces TaxID=2593676 RepID=UPI002DD7AD9C|nr:MULTISPECIES: TetR family transcriptional regulator [unclassified Streptomyces]WSA94974.1 TetR family transcriptional regulator [Streptomyces sp. NBC_01795]WSB79394.1 TetR family transcriptional regulator [Streptomyces sp. NBC_01775]WSS12400.1 TetR family transcriptional regulator [Streptomyces sp. NBC_01186]WSS41113.1 TetR family transcriptional regulator [Streptomyces sp. NBC_01187]
MTGLRERKKQRTRDALVLAAHQLFVTQGYDATTVDQIADAVEVSQRTFFRYFANKEEVALFVQDMTERRFFEGVCARPPSEAPLECLRRTLDETWDDMGEAIEAITPLKLHLRMCQIIEITPSLLAAHLRHSLLMEQKLVQEIARRTGVDPERDPRPRVLVAAFTGVMLSAGRHWGLRDGVSLEEARRVTQEHVEQLGPALSANWSRDEASRRA